MKTIIEIALAIAAIYSGGMYLVTAYRAHTGRLMASEIASLETFTFHLGLCFILSVGFLGLML